jgi:hypothetical protein
MKKNSLSFFSFLFSLVINFCNAQTGTETPYSRYGIGELQFNGFARQTAMGALGAAYQHASALNFSNPASYSALRISTFETALRGEIARTSSSSNAQTKKGTLLNYLALGFPVIKDNWGASFGLIPVSATGYNLKDTGSVLNPNDTISTSFSKLYEGKGGLSRFYIGNGFAPFAKGLDKFYTSNRYKQLQAEGDSAKIKQLVNTKRVLKGISFGFNASYLFGSLINQRSLQYNTTAFINTKLVDNTSFGDFYFDYGLMYNYEFKNDRSLTIGVSGAGGTNISSRRDILWTLVSSSSVASNIDTIYFVEGQKGRTFIPATISAGFMFQSGEKWMWGAEYALQQWSKYKSVTDNQKLQDSYRLSFGGQYMPTYKFAYRAGFRYEKSYLDLRNTVINDYALSLGVGVPIRLSSTERRLFENRTMLHFTIEGGQKGTTANSLIKQDYVRFYVGITANELWFIKRKYD